MNKSKYHLYLVSTAACTKRMVESTEGLGQRYAKGDTNDCFIFTVGFPSKIWQKLQWMLVQT